MRHDFRIGFALIARLALKHLGNARIFDDPVVNDGNVVGSMRMGIASVGLTVRCPAV